MLSGEQDLRQMRQASVGGIIGTDRGTCREEKPMRIETKLEQLGLVLPEAPKIPPGVQVPFAWVRVYEDRAYVAGIGPLNSDGSIAQPLGKVGVDLSPEEGYQAARLTALSILGSLKRELGDLDRVTAWLMVYGLVNSEPESTQRQNVINGFSDLILELYGPEAGTHARMAPGMATLPLGVPVTIAAEVAISS